MKTKFFFALLMTMLSVMPMQAQTAVSQDNDGQVIVKVFPNTEVYLFTSTGQTYVGHYYIVIDYLKKGQQLTDYRWSYILKDEGMLEDATGKCGGIDRDEKGAPIDQFKQKFYKLNEILNLKIIDVVVRLGIN